MNEQTMRDAKALISSYHASNAQVLIYFFTILFTFFIFICFSFDFCCVIFVIFFSYEVLSALPFRLAGLLHSCAVVYEYMYIQGMSVGISANLLLNVPFNLSILLLFLLLLVTDLHLM